MSHTIKTKAVNVPYKGLMNGQVLTLNAIEFESIEYDLFGSHVLSCYITFRFTRDKDGKEYYSINTRTHVDENIMFVFPTNKRGKADLYRRV